MFGMFVIMLAVGLGFVGASAAAVRAAGLTRASMDVCTVEVPSSALNNPRDLPGPFRFRGNATIDARACSSALGGGASMYQLEAELSPSLGWETRLTGNLSVVLAPASRGVASYAAALLNRSQPSGLLGPSAFWMTAAAQRRDAQSSRRLVVHPTCTGKCQLHTLPPTSRVCASPLSGGAVSPAMIFECFCRSQLEAQITALGPVDGPVAFFAAAATTSSQTARTDWTPTGCAPVVQSLLLAQGSTWAVSVASTLLSALIPLAVRAIVKVGNAALFSEEDDRSLSFGLQAFAQAWTTWGALLVVNAKVPVLHVLLPDESGVFTFGSPSVEWHAFVGAVVVQTMLLTAVVPHILGVLDMCVRGPLSRAVATQTATDQAVLEAKLMPPLFRTEARLPAVLNIFASCVIFAPSFPVLPLVGALSLGLLYFVEKLVLLRSFRRPDIHAPLITAKSTSQVLPLVFILHCAFSLWLYTDPELWPTKPAHKDPSSVGLEARALVPAAWPQLAAIGVALACWAWVRLAPQGAACLTRWVAVEWLSGPFTAKASGLWSAFTTELPPFTEPVRYTIDPAIDVMANIEVPPALARLGWRHERPKQSRKPRGSGSSQSHDEPPGTSTARSASSTAPQGRKPKALTRVWTDRGPGAEPGDPMTTWQSLLDRDSHVYNMGSASEYQDAFAMLLPAMRKAASRKDRGSASVPPSAGGALKEVTTFSHAVGRGGTASPGAGALGRSSKASRVSFADDVVTSAARPGKDSGGTQADFGALEDQLGIASVSTSPSESSAIASPVRGAWLSRDGSRQSSRGGSRDATGTGAPGPRALATKGHKPTLALGHITAPLSPPPPAGQPPSAETSAALSPSGAEPRIVSRRVLSSRLLGSTALAPPPDYARV